jgi:enoyl-CoA hydratase/carnithine racemase
MEATGTRSENAPLIVDDRGSVRWIMFNRPKVHNAQNVAMLESLDSVLVETARSRTVRVVVLGGNGPSFCSGHDLAQMASNEQYKDNNRTAEGRYRQELRLFVEPVERFRSLPMPTICRVQGHCLAAGLMFVATADFVVAADDARFGSPIVRNMAVNDAEVFTYAIRLGERRAKQLIWLDDRMDAVEAERYGMVNWVVPSDKLDAKVEEVAARLADAPPTAIALSKATFQFAADRAGERDINRFHYALHQFSHQTSEAESALSERVSRLVAGGSAVGKPPRSQ